VCASATKRFMERKAHALDMLQVMKHMPPETNGFSFAPRGD